MASNAPTSPPPIKSQRGRMLILAVAGAIVAAILLLIVLNIDRTAPETAHAWSDDGVIELVPPQQLAADDVAGEIGSLKRDLRNLGAENTWIQTSKDGKLSQQYRFASHDPNPEGLPPGWSKVLKPEIQIFLSDDRVVTLQSESALMRAPSQRVESGRMSGSVLIRVYELDEPYQFEPDARQPALEARTDEAFFDNVQGEVRCEGDVDVQTLSAHLPGSGLRIVLNDLESRVERLRMEKVGVVRLAAFEEELDASPRAQGNEPPVLAPTAPAPSVGSNDSPAAKSTRPKSRRGKSNRAAKTAPPAPVFYRLTLNDNVHIQQRGQTDGWSADGDGLGIVFSSENKSFGSTFGPKTPVGMHQPDHSMAAMQPIPVVVASLALAVATADEGPGIFHPSSDDILITCDGGLTMVPLSNADERPASTQDARLELTGRPVQLRSHPDAADIRASVFEYHTLEQRMVLKGTAEYPGLILSPELEGSFEQFWLSRLTNVGGFRGGGWLILRERINPALASQPAPADEAPKDLRIEWQRDVDMTFDKPVHEARQGDGSRSIGKLRRAVFNEHVTINSDEVDLRADAVTANFPASEIGGGSDQARASIDSILAAGSVHAVSLTNEGSISCDVLNVQFARAADGRSVPIQMTATGEVAAIDRDHQTVWSESFDVTFNPPDVAADTATPPPGSSGRAPRVKSLVALTNVQVLMADGARAFADRLDADARTEVVELTGDDVMVLSERGLIYGGKRFVLHKADNTALWPGGGQFAYFTNALSVESTRIPRPVIDQIDLAANPIQMRASWSESMRFDGAFNDGAGALTLTGNVNGESWPTALERNTMTAQSLTMHFVHIVDSEPGQPIAAAQSSGLNTIAGPDRRRLSKFITTGGEAETTLESRTWINADHSDRPRVYYIAGRTIEYDSQTLESKVPGAGVLLVRDERTEEQPAPANGSVPFSSKGTSTFRWKDHLHMTRRTDAAGMYDIAMIGGVEVLHQALDRSVSTMTGEQLHATVERLAQANVQRAEGGAAFDLGGAMELRRLHAIGSVYIKSPTRDIECEDLDYDYVAGTATLSALPNRTVTVMTAGNPNPLRAEQVVWNLIEDKVSATNVRGAGPR